MSDTPRTAHALKYADSIADMGEWMGALERELAALAAALPRLSRRNRATQWTIG